MIFLVLIISIGAISAEKNDSFNETLTADENIAIDDNLEQSSTDELQTIENKTFTDFNNDISNKTEVSLESNYAYLQENDTNYKNGFTIDRDLTINGNGYTLNPNGNLLFNVTGSGKLTLNNLTIINSYTKPAAMIYNDGNLILNNVTFTVERHILSTIASNTKVITIQNNGEMLVNNSIFRDSLIYSSHITSSTNTYISGLIYNTNSLTIENTVFDNNDLVNPSGNNLGRTIDICALLHNEKNMTLNNVIIENTNVSYVPATYPRFKGIVFNKNGRLEINGSIFRNNYISFSSTNFNFRGVIFSESDTSELIMSNSILINNTNLNENVGKSIVDYKGTANLNNNYWGTNNPDFTKLVEGTAPSTYVNLTFVPEELTTGVEKTFEITFTVNDVLITTLPDFNVTINSKKLGSEVVEIKNGVGEYKYLPITDEDDVITLLGEECNIVINAAATKGFTDLSTLINESSEISLVNNYVYQSNDSALQTGIPINKEVTIEGNGFTINSTNLARLFNIGTAGKLTLRNVVLITDNVVSENGGSNANILNKGELILDGVTFTSKRIWESGTIIASTILNYDANSKMTIKNSVFEDSLVNYTDTAGTVSPYGLIFNKGTLLINNTLFRNNGIYSLGKTMNNQFGGLIYENGVSLTIENTLVEKNFVTHITTQGTASTLLNGLICSYGKAVTINNCTFRENNLSTASTNANANAFGAICMRGGTLNIANSNFVKNNAQSGSAIATSVVAATINSMNNTFEENTALNGGAIYIYHNGILKSSNDVYKRNSAENGGAIYAKTFNTNYANVSVENSIFEDNIATTGTAIYKSNLTVANNNYWASNNPNFETLISDGTNSMTPNNHVIITVEGDTTLFPESSKEYTVNFRNNDTNAICELPDYNVDLYATNSLSDENVTLQKGTASFTYTASLEEMNDTIKVLINSNEKARLEIIIKENENGTGTFKELDRIIKRATDEINLTKDFVFNSTVDSGLENGIVINKTLTINGNGFKINGTTLAKLFNVESTGNLTLKDVNIITDFVACGSYSIRPESSIKNSGILTLDNVTFTVNQNVSSTESSFAAPIYNSNTLNIVNSKFVDSNINTNTQYCFGLIDNAGGVLNIANTVFDSNSMIESSSMDIYANGLIYNMGTLTLNNVNMTNNYMETPKNARALIRAYTNSNITIDNSLFENNTIYTLGNNAAGTVIYAEDGSMTISNSKFIKNTGARSGGAIYSIIGITFINNTFEKNNASEYGGAIYGYSDSNYINNTFKENKAKYGGALYSSKSLQPDKSHYFKDNTFISNYASKYGGAVNAAEPIGTVSNPIDNNVFINNEALDRGGAIYSSGAIRVTNTIFQGNMAGTGAAIYSLVSSGGTSARISLIQYSIFDNNIIKSPTGKLVYYYGTSTAENNYWGTNTPNLNDLIGLSGGTYTAPTNIALITIEGNETLTEGDVYEVFFKGNASKEIIALPNFTADVTATLNTVTPTSIVINMGSGSFMYNAENKGTDTIKISKNNVEITKLNVKVITPPQNPEFSIVAGDVNYGDKLNFTFTVTAGPVGANIYKWSILDKDNTPLETGYITENNEIKYVNSYNAGNYTIKVELKDVDGWHDLVVSDAFEIKPIATEINPTITVKDDDTVEITVIITSSYENNIGGTVSFELDTTYNGNVENGTVTITTNKLSPNKYNTTLNYSGDANYVGNTKNVEFIVKKTVNTDVFNVTPSEDNRTFTFSIILPSDATGNLTVKVSGISESKAIENGKANITITGLTAGPHDATIGYTGDEYYKSASKIITVVVPGSEIPSEDINVSKDIPVGTTSPEFTIQLPKDAKGNFTVYIDGTPYTQELVNGSAVIKVGELSVGNHTISTEYSGDDKYNNFRTANETLNIPKASIPGGKDAINMTTPSSSATPSFTIKLPTDATGNLTVTVDGKKTYTQALVNGSATVKVPKLASGKHTLTVTYSGDKKYTDVTKTTTVNVPAPVIKLSKNKNINMLYSAGTKYKVLVTVDGKAAVGVKVAIKFNGKTKKVTTNKKGYAIYKIPTVKPKKYTITATYKGKTVKNTVKVNNIIKASNKKVKKSKKVTKVKITLKKVNKKVLKKKTLKIKFKGKVYKVKTNKKGTATWKVKKSMLKALKVGKKYKYTVTYGKDVVSKKLTIKK